MPPLCGVSWSASPYVTSHVSPSETRPVTPHDAVNHPTHYNAHPRGIECIDVIEHFNLNIGNAVKYLWRAGLKGDAIEDLRKAAWYALREAKRLGWREDVAPKQAAPVRLSTPASRVFFYLDAEDNTLCVRSFDDLPFDRGELHPLAGAVFVEGTVYARTAICAKDAARNTQLYDESTRAAFADLARQIEEWHKELLQPGPYIQVQPAKR